MQQYEFLNYIETPSEKHLGIATIKLWNRLILKFKVIPNKDGTGFFLGCASYKIPDPMGAGGDYYTEAFCLDSRSEHEAVCSFLRAHINQAMAKGNATTASQDPEASAPKHTYPAHLQASQNVPNEGLPF